MKSSIRFMYDLIRRLNPDADIERDVKPLLGMYGGSKKHIREANELMDIVSGGDADKSSVTRRHIFQMAATMLAVYSLKGRIEGLYEDVSGWLEVGDDFIFGEGSDVDTNTLIKIEKQGFGTTFKQISPFAESSDSMKLWRAAEAFAANSLDKKPHLQFLHSLQFRRGVDEAVRGYAAFLRSAFINRMGAAETAQECLLKGYNLDEVPDWLYLTNLVEDASQKFVANSPMHFNNSDIWTATGSIKKINQRFGEEINSAVSGNGSIDSRLRIKNCLDEFQTPFIRSLWLHTSVLAAAPSVNVAERREIWNGQIALYKTILTPSIGGLRYRRGIWNECMAMAVQAHRFEDFEYRDKFIRACLDPEFFNIPVDIYQDDLRRRAENLDHSFVMLMLFINRLAIDGVKYHYPIDVEIEFRSILDRREQNQNFQVRAGLDAFRKRFSMPSDVDDSLPNYSGSSVGFASYIIDVPFDGSP